MSTKTEKATLDGFGSTPGMGHSHCGLEKGGTSVSNKQTIGRQKTSPKTFNVRGQPWAANRRGLYLEVLLRTANKVYQAKCLFPKDMEKAIFSLVVCGVTWSMLSEPLSKAVSLFLWFWAKWLGPTLWCLLDSIESIWGVILCV